MKCCKESTKKLVKLHCIDANLFATAGGVDAWDKKLNVLHFVTMAIPIRIH